MRGEKLHGPWREGRSERTPLMPPGAPLAGEQPLPEERLEDPEGCAGSAVVLRVIDQHMADRFRGVEENRGAAEDPADNHLFLVGSLRPDPQVVGAHQLCELARTEVVRRRIRMRRDEGLRALRGGRWLHPACLTRPNTKE